MVLTCASVFVVDPDPVAVGDGDGQVVLEEGIYAARKTPVVHMVQLTVVVVPVGGSEI